MEQVVWEERNRFLLSSIVELIRQVAPKAKTGLDVGSQEGVIVRQLADRASIEFLGIEPLLKEESETKNGILIKKASAHSIPFDEASFDVVTLTSVYEHILPKYRLQSLNEIHRVLKPDGVLVGQIPNMNFPIELHSRLPLQQFLPRKLADWYLRKLSPVSWNKNGTNWYRVGPSILMRDAKRAGFREGEVRKFNYPREVLSPSLQRFYFVTSIVSLGYIFYFRKRNLSRLLKE